MPSPRFQLAERATSRLRARSTLLLVGLRRAAAPIALALCIALGAAQTAPRGDAGPSVDNVHQALGLLNYLIGDYPLAVDDAGNVLDEFEYREQVTLLSRVREMLVLVGGSEAKHVQHGAACVDDVDALIELVGKPGAPQPVVTAAGKLRDTLVSTFGLRLAPASKPSLSRGRAVYTTSCVECHGTTGRARTPRADQLRPRPTDLLSRHLDLTLSPYQTFNVVTYGVAGTAMPSFEVLSTAERWDVAFYVMAMRQRAVPRASVLKVTPPLDVLSRLTDAELAAWLADRGVPAERRASELARLRSTRAWGGD